MKKYFAYLICALFLFPLLPNTAFSQNEHPGYYQQWFDRHKDENGEVPSRLHLDWYQHDLRQSQRLATRGISSVASIEQLATATTQGGRTRAILVDERDNNRIFAGSVSGGLWRSDDAGQNWTAINDAASNLSVTCLAQNPVKPTEIYYGTGENRNSGQPFGVGIFKSTDGGQTFNLLKNTEGVNDMTRVNFLTHSPNKDAIIYAATYNGLYISTNAGDTWTKILAGNISGIISFPDGHALATVQGSGIFIAPDGRTFTQISNVDFPPSAVGRIALANCKAFPQTVFALFGSPRYDDQDANMGIYRSFDGGKNWVFRSDSSNVNNGRIGPTYTSYCLMLGVSPTDTNAVVIGSVNSKISGDGGKTWRSYNSGHSDNHVITPIGNSNFFFAGNDGGIYKGDWGTNATTNASRGYSTTQFYGGNYAPTGKIAVGGTQDNGSWRYNGNTMTKIQGADGGFAHVSQQDADLAYASIQNGVVNRTLNFQSTANFGSITPTTAVAEGVNFINLYEINPANGNQLYYRTNKGLWRTLNTGTKWERMHTSTISSIQAIGVSDNTNPSVYIGGANCFYRIDSAAKATTADSDFVDLRTSVPAAIKNDAWGNISFQPKNATILYVGLTSQTNSPRIYKVTKANTANPEWTDLQGNLPARLTVYQVQAHPDRPDSVLYAATAFGLYITNDGGKTWVKETRVPNVAIYEMKLRVNDRTLFLFTHGRSVWYLQLTDFTTTKTQDIGAWALNIYPNPANDVLNIETATPLSIVQVFDVQGREILTSKNTQNISTASFKSGLYFIKAFDEKGRFVTKSFVKN